MIFLMVFLVKHSNADKYDEDNDEADWVGIVGSSVARIGVRVGGVAGSIAAGAITVAPARA